MIILLIVLCTTEGGKSNISAKVYKLEVKTTIKDLSSHTGTPITNTMDSNGWITSYYNAIQNSIAPDLKTFHDNYFHARHRWKDYISQSYQLDGWITLNR